MLLLWLCFAATPAVAQDTSLNSSPELTYQRIQDQGFEIIKIKRTWLGRLKVTAIRDDDERTIVINRINGDILSDIWRSRSRSRVNLEATDDDRPSSNGGASQSGGGGSKPPGP